MKKIFSFVAVAFCFCALTTTFISCGNDDDQKKDPNSETNVPNSDAVTKSDLIGTWTSNSTDFVYAATFTADDVTLTENGQQTFKGQYTVENGVVKFGVGLESAPGLLYDKSVLIMKSISTDDRGRKETLGMILFKQGKEINIPKEDIQGQWCWYSVFINDEIIRTAIKFEGDNFELIITPWGERYVGTYVYSNGIIKLNVSDGYTSREEGTGNGELWGRLDPYTLECDDWRTLYRENWHVDAVSHTPFVANGSEAYGFIANIPTVLQKKR